jgi:hypothetical protein
MAAKLGQKAAVDDFPRTPTTRLNLMFDERF